MGSALDNGLHGRMGNKPSNKPRSPLVSFEKLKIDVQVADTFRTFPSSQHLHFNDKVLAASSLIFRLMVTKKVSKAMLPLVWKFRNNCIVEVTTAAEGNVSHFDPKSFYVLYSVLKDVQKALSQNMQQQQEEQEEEGEKKEGISKDVELRQSSYDDNECALCMDSKVDVVTTCAHAFCNSCLENWKNQNSGDPTCPVCRGPLAPKNSDDSWIMDTTDSNENLKSAINFMSERVLSLVAKHRVVAASGKEVATLNVQDRN